MSGGLDGAARIARLDQASAGVEEAVDGFVTDIRAMGAVSHGEALLALSEVLGAWDTDNVALLAAGALLRLAKERQ